MSRHHLRPRRRDFVDLLPYWLRVLVAGVVQVVGVVAGGLAVWWLAWLWFTDYGPVIGCALGACP